jgi:hypothetical protein
MDVATILFSKVDMMDQIRAYPQRIFEEVQAWSRDRVLGTPTEDLVAHFVNRYALNVPSLHLDQMHVARHGEEMVERQDWDRIIRVPGNFFTYAIPFDGDKDLFFWRGNAFTTAIPRANILLDRVEFTIRGQFQVPEEIKTRAERIVQDLVQWLGFLQNPAAEWGEQCPEIARRAIEERKQKILEQEKLVAALGVPIARQADAPRALAVGIAQKPRPVSLPAVPKNAFNPEPVVTDAQFGSILETIENMAKVWERSPSAFKAMGEEDLRTTLLFALNGQYSSATAETFNKEGKTDILIREGGRNVFIAECKIWSGPKALAAAIDQILSYLTWRDSKAALLVFNRNKNFTDVLTGLGRAVVEHPNYKRSLKVISESHAHYMFKQQDDAARETVLAVMAFDVPK